MKSIQIDDSVPPPEGRKSLDSGRAVLRDAFRRMKPGESFVWPNNKAPLAVAGQLGIKITTRYLAPDQYRVWLLQ